MSNQIILHDCISLKHEEPQGAPTAGPVPSGTGISGLEIPRLLRALATGGTLALVLMAGHGLAQEQPTPSALDDYRPVTAELLTNPEDSDWLMIRRTYNGWGYSPLGEITPDNIDGLRPVWGFSTGEERAHEAPPIINDGVMFVSTPQSQVIAIDARTGDLLWRYRRPRPAGASVFHETNRGVALLRG